MIALENNPCTGSRVAAVMRSHQQLVLEDHWWPAFDAMCKGADPLSPEIQDHWRVIEMGEQAYAETMALAAPEEWWRDQNARATMRFGRNLNNSPAAIGGPYPRCRPVYDSNLAVAFGVGVVLGIINALRKKWCAA